MSIEVSKKGIVRGGISIWCIGEKPISLVHCHKIGNTSYKYAVFSVNNFKIGFEISSPLSACGYLTLSL